MRKALYQREEGRSTGLSCGKIVMFQEWARMNNRGEWQKVVKTCFCAGIE
jgi:hypothetical protein